MCNLYISYTRNHGVFRKVLFVAVLVETVDKSWLLVENRCLFIDSWSRKLGHEEEKRMSELVGRTSPPSGASRCINPITFSPVHGTVFYPIYHTERRLLRSTFRANTLTIQHFPTSVEVLSSEITALTFKISNQITLQQPVDTTAISRTETRAC